MGETTARDDRCNSEMASYWKWGLLFIFIGKDFEDFKYPACISAPVWRLFYACEIAPMSL